MKTISSILAIAAIMATTEAMFEDMSENFLNRLHATYVDPGNDRSLASTVNSDVDVRFFFWDESTKKSVTLRAEDPPQILPDPPRNHPTCGNDFGVHIRDINLFFCKITSFKVEVINDASDEPRQIRLKLFLKKDGLLPLMLVIPVLKLPLSAPQTEIEFGNWGRYYGVGTNPPFDFEKLLETENTQSMTIDFIWLKDLLGFGVTKKPTPTIIPIGGQQVAVTSYVTRPLLLSEDLMERTKEFIDTLNDPNEESVGSNRNTPNDDSDEESTSGL